MVELLIVLNRNHPAYERIAAGIRKNLNELESVTVKEVTEAQKPGTLTVEWTQVTEFVLQHAEQLADLAKAVIETAVVLMRAAKNKGKNSEKPVVNNNTDTKTIDEFVRETVSTKVSLLCADEHSGYRYLKPDYPHKFVRHSAGEHVVGAVHSQTIEGFWSIFKRGEVGTFHEMSAKYKPLYVAEFQFRHNNRGNADIFGAAIKGC
jgi:ISXO2-like transposase domain